MTELQTTQIADNLIWVHGKHAGSWRSASRSEEEWSLAMSYLTLFGLFAVTLMMVCYALEDRSPGFVLGFAIACVLGSVYGFLQGAWPFGLVEAVWSIVAARRWRHARRSAGDSINIG